MAIQFQCSACRQPIEVDDQFANQQAVCPFCRKVITVPASSSLAAGSIPEARPSDLAGVGSPPPVPMPQDPPSWDRPIGDLRSPAPPPGYPPQGYGYPPPRVNPVTQRAAATYGNYSLICLALALAMAAGAMLIMLPIVTPAFNSVAWSAGSQPSQAAMQQEIQKALMEASSKNQSAVGLAAALTLGTCFFGLIGFVLAIVSLRHSTDNWRGWLSLVGSGLFVLCCCGGQLLSLVSR